MCISTPIVTWYKYVSDISHLCERTHSCFTYVASDTWPLHMSSYVRRHKDPFICHHMSEDTKMYLTYRLSVTRHSHNAYISWHSLWLDTNMFLVKYHIHISHVLQVIRDPFICQMIQICISRVSSLWNNTFMFRICCRWYVTPSYVIICQIIQIYISRVSSLWNNTFIFQICCKCTWPLHVSSYVRLYKYVSHISHHCERTHSCFTWVASDPWPLYMSPYVRRHKYVSHAFHHCEMTHSHFTYVASVRDPFICQIT
jgi:hypothetical protein